MTGETAAQTTGVGRMRQLRPAAGEDLDRDAEWKDVVLAPEPHGPRSQQPRDPVRIPPVALPPEANFVSQWLRQSFLELGALPSAVPCARLHARQMIWEWRLPGLRDTTELVVSELVTNAVQVSRADAQTSPVRLWLVANHARVLILVWDACPVSPVRVSASGNDESGRGLLLVETLSRRWNWYLPAQPGGGKVVWALLEAP